MPPAPVLPALALVLSLLPLAGCLDMFAPSAAPSSTSSTAATTYDAELALCVSVINSYRASVGRPALSRDDQLETYAAQAARNDAEARQAHTYLKSTSFGNGLVRAENELLWWPLSTYGSISTVIEKGLAEMWRAGPDGTHYKAMAGEYVQAGCGIFVSNGEVTVVQAFR